MLPFFLWSWFSIFTNHTCIYLLTYLLTRAAWFCSPTPFILGHRLRSDLSMETYGKNDIIDSPLPSPKPSLGKGGGQEANYLRFIAKQQAEISHRLFPCFPTETLYDKILSFTEYLLHASNCPIPERRQNLQDSNPMCLVKKQASEMPSHVSEEAQLSGRSRIWNQNWLCSPCLS